MCLSIPFITETGKNWNSNNNNKKTPLRTIKMRLNGNKWNWQRREDK